MPGLTLFRGRLETELFMCGCVTISHHPYRRDQHHTKRRMRRWREKIPSEANRDNAISDPNGINVL